MSDRDTGAGGTSLSQRSAGGVLWNGATFATSKLLVLAATIVLARLLTPDDFGLVGIGLLVISYLDLVNDFGINAAVIQHRGDPVRVANVAFWVNMSLAVALTSLAIVGAPLVADFFDEPRATAVVRVLALTMLLTSAGAIHQARLRRSMQFKRRLVPELARAVAKGGVAITLALSGAGVWSLVWGQIAGELVAAVCYWIVMPWLPRPTADRRLTRDLFRFGSHIAAVGVLGTVLRNVDYLVIGRALGTRALGLYTLAFRLPQLLIEGAVTIVGQVAFPAFARLQTQPDRLRSGLLRGLRLTSLVITPLSLGLAFTADPFIRAVYGERWVAAITVMRLLALYMLVQGATRLCGEVYKAMGRASLLSRLAIVKLVITVPLVLFAVEHGIVAVAAAQLVAASTCTVLDAVLAQRIVGVTFRQLLVTFLPAVRAGTAMSVGSLLAVWATSGFAPMTRLLLITTVGAVSYGAALMAFDRSSFDEFATFVRQRRTRDTTRGQHVRQSSPAGSR
ncbi:MAG TPA: lipopolysaccharide biosynthesis protein [Ilumatobacter sp.]|nr:lipopolysaccharide biosynthesis protein [Ilumatobacter sp.]